MLLSNLSHHLPSLVCSGVDADAPAAWVCRAAPVFAWDPANGRFRCGLREQTVEYVTDVVGLLSIRRVLWPALRPFLEHVVWNDAFGVTFQPINPGVADAV